VLRAGELDRHESGDAFRVTHDPGGGFAGERDDFGAQAEFGGAAAADFGERGGVTVAAVDEEGEDRLHGVGWVGGGGGAR